MQKIAIAFQGRPDSGKTETLKNLIANLISQKGAKLICEISRGSDKGVIIELNKVLIGIETQGDPNSNLEIRLDRLVGKKCNIIICATRTYGGTVNEFSSACSNYERIEIHQQYISSSLSSNTDGLRDIVSKRNIEGIRQVCQIP